MARTLFCYVMVMLCAATWPAAAMQFTLDTSKDGVVFVIARGEIHQGDLRLFRQALANVPAGARARALVVDSPGGNLIEGEKLAAQVRESDLAVIIGSDSQCASACFLLLAASAHRIAGTSALVGVHSASIDGKETMDSMAMTLMMQRIAGSYGIPPAIIGKMAQTAPGRIEWLTHDDLTLMSVKIIDDASDAPQPEAAPVSTPMPAPPAPQPPVPAPRPAVQARPPAVWSNPASQDQAEFQGALFCAQGTAKLSLRTVDSADRTRRRAVFDFGPMAGGRPVPAGSFMLEGRFDLAGDVIDLRPTGWLSVQPPNFAMLGLTGRSDDGGKTFSGHATVSAACTVFTLKRTR